MAKHEPGNCLHYRLVVGLTILVNHDEPYDYCTADDEED